MLRAWREDHPPAALGKRSASPATFELDRYILKEERDLIAAGIGPVPGIPPPAPVGGSGLLDRRWWGRSTITLKAGEDCISVGHRAKRHFFCPARLGRGGAFSYAKSNPIRANLADPAPRDP